MKCRRWALATAAALLLLAGCRPAATQEPDLLPDVAQPPIGLSAVGTPAPTASPEPVGNSYIQQVVRETAARLLKPGMSDDEKAKAAFDYLIATTDFHEPAALDLWQLRGGAEKPTYLESRSLSVLLFGWGECEDYAAALTLLLREMGLEAMYLPGLTYSVEGALVDHAWTVVQVDGVWYHLDSQLEDNVTRDDTIRYRYFLRGDATLIASHRWGQNLIDSNLLTDEQNREIAQQYLPPVCPKDYPTPPAQRFVPKPPCDREMLLEKVEQEREAYAQQHGEPVSIPLPAVPPVFGRQGFGPPD